MLEEINMNRDLDRSVMAGELLSALMQLCSDYQKNGFEFYRKKWAEYDMCAGHDVQVIAENDHYNGVCMGINNKGALRVMVDGAEQIFYAAEVSVRVQASKNAVN